MRHYKKEKAAKPAKNQPTHRAKFRWGESKSLKFISGHSLPFLNFVPISGQFSY